MILNVSVDTIPQGLLKPWFLVLFYSIRIVSVDTIPQGLLKLQESGLKKTVLLFQWILFLKVYSNNENNIEEWKNSEFQWILFRKVYSNKKLFPPPFRRKVSVDTIPQGLLKHWCYQRWNTIPGFSGYYSARFTQTFFIYQYLFTLDVSVDTIPQGLLKQYGIIRKT